MGTRSTISMANDDGTVTSIYCHWDGYISHHGPILLKHYSTKAKVKSLMKLHSLSILGEFIGKRHDFDQRFPTTKPRPCTSHVRDRGDLAHAYFGLLKDVDFQEFNYLFRGSKWQVMYSDDDNDWHDLELELITARLTT